MQAQDTGCTVTNNNLFQLQQQQQQQQQKGVKLNATHLNGRWLVKQLINHGQCQLYNCANINLHQNLAKNKE